MELIKNNNNKNYLMILPILITLILYKPLNLDFSQSMVLTSLFMVVLWWGTGIVHKNIASLSLILMFLIFGNTPIHNVFYFPLSSNIILVIASYMLSQGIVNSQVADRFATSVLQKYCNTSIKLIYMSFVLGIALIFVIPQPFPRVILLSSIYMNYLRKIEIGDEEKKVVLFSVFAASTVTSLLFLNGDIIINNAIQGFGEVTIDFMSWIKYMTLPAFITTILVAIGFQAVFRKNLVSSFKTEQVVRKQPLSKSEGYAILITALVIALWLTESLHGITSANTAVIGVFLMFMTGIVTMKDFKAVNIGLLIFLTAEFAIGKVLVGSGIARSLSNSLTTIFPSNESMLYIPFIIGLVMILHMIMGSLVTALSVLIPTLIAITHGHLSSELVVLLTAVSVCFHYLMPFHHVTIMLGYGNDYFDNRHVLKFGAYLTLLTFVSALFIFLPWWKMIGLL